MKTSKQLFNENLKRMMRDSGLSKVDFARKCGITRQSLHLYESGETSPTLDILDRICKRLEIPHGDFLGEASSPSLQALLRVPPELVSLWEKASSTRRDSALKILRGKGEEGAISKV